MIEVDGLTRRYGDFTAVDAVSFDIADGEVVGLLGHNGAGKTTIMKMLTGFLEPSAGALNIAGVDARRDRRAVQRLIGYLPENCPVYPDMTVVDYLDYHAALHGMPDNERPAALRRAVQRTWLQDKALAPISTLSRGYRQRVGVAQAILHRPPILILDEPTNGLDPGQIRQMRSLIRELAETSTVILSTHILQEVAAVCDRVLVMRGGRLALDARLDALAGEPRLRVTLDAPPAVAGPLLASVPGVTGVQSLGAGARGQCYAVTLGDEAASVADAVARAAVAGGVGLFGLAAESADLESLFRELEQEADGA